MLEQIKEHFGLIQLSFALILGMIIQYMMGDKKGRRIFWLIVVSSLFTAMMISNLIYSLDGKEFFGFIFNITPTSPLIIIGVGLSALISMEMVAITMVLLPQTLRKKIKAKLEIEVNNESPE